MARVFQRRRESAEREPGGSALRWPALRFPAIRGEIEVRIGAGFQVADAISFAGTGSPVSFEPFRAVDELHRPLEGGPLPPPSTGVAVPPPFVRSVDPTLNVVMR